MTTQSQEPYFKLPSSPTTVTDRNIEAVREQLPYDQANELEVGCVTWAFEYQASTMYGVLGRMTIWPSGRGAIEFGADSFWGKWDDEDEELTTDDGAVFNRIGLELS